MAASSSKTVPAIGGATDRNDRALTFLPLAEGARACAFSIFSVKPTSMKSKAAVLHSMGASYPYAESRPLRIEEVEIDAPGYGEVLIKVAAAGLCHSDLSVINGDRPRPMPMALGHEASGVVVQCCEGERWLRSSEHALT